MSQQKPPEERDRDISEEAANQMKATDGGLRGTGGSPGFGVNSGADEPAPEQHKEAAKRAPAADQKPAAAGGKEEAE